jgi:hypothetical protein
MPATLLDVIPIADEDDAGCPQCTAETGSGTPASLLSYAYTTRFGSKAVGAWD